MEVRWRVDLSSTNAVRMRNYPDDAQERLERAYQALGDKAATIIAANRTQYRCASPTTSILACTSDAAAVLGIVDLQRFL